MLKIIDNFIKNTDTLDELYKFFHYSGSWQFDFLSHKYVYNNKQNSTAEELVCQIIKALCAYDLGFNSKGYEAWINVLDKDINHLNHHVDCNEFAEEMEPAKKTAVIYLGSGDSMEGGELAINLTEVKKDYCFYDNIYDLEKYMDNSWLKIPYKYNRLILFDSNYPHAILPIKHLESGSSRISLTVCSWDKKIKVKR